MNKSELFHVKYCELISLKMAKYRFENGAAIAEIKQFGGMSKWHNPIIDITIKLSDMNISALLAVESVLEKTSNLIGLIEIEIEATANNFEPLRNPLHFEEISYCENWLYPVDELN